jgi:hypothetical protein
MTSHSRVSNKIKTVWIKHKDIIQRLVQSVLSPTYISIDIWTSPNRYLLLVIYAHFTIYDSKKQKVLLALKQVNSYTGEDQFVVLLLVLEDYSIVRKLGAIIADNTSTNNTLCQVI